MKKGFLITSLPIPLIKAVKEMAAVEGIDVNAIISDAIVEHILSTSPEFMPNDFQFRNERNMTIKIVNKIMADGIDAFASAILITKSDEDFLVRHKIDGSWQIKESFPAPWLPSLIKRLQLMARVQDGFYIEHNRRNFKITLELETPERLHIKIFDADRPPS